MRKIMKSNEIIVNTSTINANDIGKKKRNVRILK